MCDGGRAGEAGEAKEMLEAYSVQRTSLVAVLPKSARWCTTCRELALTWPGVLPAAPPLNLSSCERRQWLRRWPPTMPGRLCFALPMPTPLRRSADDEASSSRKTVWHTSKNSTAIGVGPKSRSLGDLHVHATHG